MWQQQRRKKVRTVTFPPEWSRILELTCPFFRQLSKADREELQGHIQVFLAEKNFEGCGGLEITDEMRVCIAAQACVLLLHRETDFYPGLHSILVYPSTYFGKATTHLGSGIMEETQDARAGEAWPSGAVVLAWDQVRRGTADPTDGYNVVFHEFAHQLDFEDGQGDGAPELGGGHLWFGRKSRYAAWARVLSGEFEQLRADVERGQPSVLRDYGATNPTEFFAVATETFFERSREMKEKHPALYDELKQYYQQDPAQWSVDGRE